MIADAVTEASARFGVPGGWIRSLIRVESAGRPDAISPAGAMGLMQLMPQTWRQKRAELQLGDDPFDPHDNIIAGTAYLRWLHDQYGQSGFLAAYNAGPGRYEAFRDGRQGLPAETVRYLAALREITGDLAVSAPAPTAPDWRSAGLFGDPRAASGLDAPSPDTLFITTSVGAP